jgi:hypothetical protein
VAADADTSMTTRSVLSDEALADYVAWDAEDVLVEMARELQQARAALKDFVAHHDAFAKLCWGKTPCACEICAAGRACLPVEEP